MIKDKLLDLTEQTFTRKRSLYVACNEKRDVFSSAEHTKYMNHGNVKNVVTLSTVVWTNYLSDLAIKFIDKLKVSEEDKHRSPFLHTCYEKDFMMSFSEENQHDIIEAFKSNSKYLDDLLNTDHFILRFSLKGLQLNKA